MGKYCFSKLIKFFAIALLGAVTAIAAIAVLSSPAAARPGGGGDSDDYPWDTDNLRYGSYNARSFNIPFHKYGGYSGVAACQSGVADAFFQAGGSVGAVNDFPYLDWVADADGNESWAEQQGGTRRNGCDKFVEQQDEMAAQIGSNGGYYLDLSGSLQRLSDDSVPSRFSGRRVPSVHWLRKGDAFAVNSGTGELIIAQDTSRYRDRVDGWKISSNKYNLAIYPSTARWTIPEGTENGRFGSSLHGTSYQRRTDSAVLTRVAIPAGGVTNVTYSQEAGLCPGGFHPRGEDSVDRIGSHTGRTLTGLTGTKVFVADQYWCRSDLRFGRRFHPEFHRGVAKHRQAATKEFSAYGRLNCYFTAFTSGSYGGAEGIRQDPASGGIVCSYLFPIPQCDPDPDNNSDSDWRDYTAEELANAGTIGQPFNKASGADCGESTPQCTHNGTKRDMTDAELAEYRTDDSSFTPAADGSTPCSANPADPPQQAGFTADPCVTASLVIAENRVVGSDAEPGVAASDRTLAVAAGRTAWDLDITSPHHNTASPPRDTTSAQADATGCADGSEDRADHSSDAGSTVRKNTGAGVDLALPVSSAASQSTHPPHSKGFASVGTDYSGAVKNIAHRYASNVAENTCAAKKAEAELRLEMLEAEANIYKDWMSRYSTWASGMETDFSEWLDDNPALSTSSAANATFGSYKHAVRRGLRRTYASGMESFYAGRKNRSASVAGRSLTKPAVGASWCGDVSSLVSSYASSVGSLKTAATGVLTYGSALTNPGSGPSASGVSPPSAPTAGRVSSSTTGTEPKAAVYRTTNHSSSYCHTRGNLPRSGYVFGTYITYTYGGSCTITANKKTSSGTTVNINYTTTTLVTPAVAEVKATATATYNSYTLRLSSGTWSKTATVPSATGAATCNTWRTSSCYVSGSHPRHGIYVAWFTGSTPAVSDFPNITASPTNGTFTNISIDNLLGRYYALHTARTGLEDTSASVRNTTATTLGTLTATATTGEGTLPATFSASAVPATSQNATAATANTERSQINTAAATWRNTYTTAYNTAYTQATADMGTTATTTTWNNFDWRYHSPSLAWSNYQEDPATTYSASTATPRDGTGCDLIDVSSDGTVSVEATRLDYETSSYGKGSVSSTRTDAQRTCKIRRTRTPELILKYQPSRPSGTDRSKAVSSFYVDYQPTVADGQPPAERFKLYDEAEVFAVKVSLADRAPVLCYQPGEALIAHVAAKGVDAVNKAVFRNASGFAGGNKKHCYRHPSLAQLVSNGKVQQAFVFFDDTAHSAMASVNVVWQQPTPKIVAKLGSEDDLKMMANTVSLEASNAVAYVDETRTSSFYGTFYTFPTTGNSVNSPSGWDITGHPTLTLASTFTQHQVQAKDTAAKTPSTHSMVFKFIDCVFGIEDVAFVDNIASPYALLSDENGAVPGWKPEHSRDNTPVDEWDSGWKQTYDSDPHSSPTWYYPAFSTYEGARRLDGRRDSNGDPITYGRNTQGGFAHPSYDLENTAADGIGWGIVYEDKVGQQQPVWADWLVIFSIRRVHKLK